MESIIKFGIIVSILFIIGCSVDIVTKIEESRYYQDSYSLSEIEFLETKQMEDFHYSENDSLGLSISEALNTKGYLSEDCSFFGVDKVEVKFLVPSDAKYPYYRMGWKYQDNIWSSTIVQRISGSDTASDKQRVMFWRDTSDKLRITISVIYSYNGKDFFWNFVAT